MKPQGILFTAAAVAIGMALTTPGLAQTADDDAVAIEEPMIEEEFEISGEEEYFRYCSVCHGVGGKGDGPLAANLTPPPADLTRIKMKHGGFSLQRIADIIQNGGDLKGHGSSEMPAWGEVFRDQVEPVMASALIFELALYLESIQDDGSGAAKPEAPAGEPPADRPQ